MSEHRRNLEANDHVTSTGDSAMTSNLGTEDNNALLASTSLASRLASISYIS